MSDEIPSRPYPDGVPNARLATSGPMSAFRIWTLAVTKPGERTYAEIASSPRARAGTAFTWVFIAAPVTLLQTLLSLPAAFPVIGFCFDALKLITALYGLVLGVIAVKGVHQISWGCAIVSSLVAPIALTACVAIVTLGTLMVLGPTIGNTFSSINSSLQSVP